MKFYFIFKIVMYIIFLLQILMDKLLLDITGRVLVINLNLNQ